MWFKKHILITVILSFGLGSIVCFLLLPSFETLKVNRSFFVLKDTELLSDSLCDFVTGKNINIVDTLAKREKNLFVFWSPTCRFSKQFFLHQLNEQIIGIYCFPITDDLEYLSYYLEKQEIALPQIMKREKVGMRPLNIKTIVALPTFVIVDNQGNRLSQYIGINKIDEMMALLYENN